MPAKSSKPINILMSSSRGIPLGQEYQDMVQKASPRIKIRDVSELAAAENRGDAEAKKKLDAALAEVEIYFGGPLPKGIVIRAPHLKWVQSPVAGTDQFLPELGSSKVILTKAAIHEQQISETIFTGMLMLARRMIEFYELQRKKQRERLTPEVLYGKTIGIVGLGNIGKRTARLAKAFSMKVIAMRAHPDVPYTYVDKMLGPDGIHELIRESDFVVLIVPLTKDTRNLIGAAELRMMKPTAYIINVARGGVIDEGALLKAVQSKQIAGAYLDAQATDPHGPPPDSPLWTTPGIILTPHVAGHRGDYSDLLTKQFVQNLKRYLAGKKLMNIVDKKLGY